MILTAHCFSWGIEDKHGKCYGVPFSKELCSELSELHEVEAEVERREIQRAGVFVLLIPVFERRRVLPF